MIVLVIYLLLDLQSWIPVGNTVPRSVTNEHCHFADIMSVVLEVRLCRRFRQPVQGN